MCPLSFAPKTVSYLSFPPSFTVNAGWTSFGGDDITGWGLLESCERCDVTDGAFLRDVRGDGQRERRGANCGDRPVQALCYRAAGTLEAAVTSPGTPDPERSEADTAAEDSRQPRLVDRAERNRSGPSL